MIGKIESLIETGANDVIVIITLKDERVLVPFVMHEIVKEVNVELNYIKIDWPIENDRVNEI